MKKNLLFLSVLILNVLNAQNLNWNWAMNSGDVNTSIATHSSGNVYLAGQFNYSTTIGTTTLNSQQGFDTDLYVVKFNSSGAVQWAHSIGSSSLAAVRELYDIAVDNAGNAYITGYFNANMTFGTFTLTGTGVRNMFLAKYDNNGAFQWAKRVNGPSVVGSCDARGVTVDTQGDIIVTGFFSGTITAETHTLTASAGLGAPTDIFLMKYDPAGNLIWSNKSGNNNPDFANDVITDNSDDIYITGYLSSGATSVGTLAVNTGTGGTRAFYAKFNSNGNAVCVKSLGSSSTLNSTQAFQMALSGSSEVLLLGNFTGTYSIGSNTLSSIGSTDAFLCKLTNDNSNSHNTVNWIKTFGGTSTDLSTIDNCILIHNSNIYIATSLSNNLTVETTTITGDIQDAYIMKLDLNGNLNWVEKFGGTSADAVMGIAASGSDIYVTGNISNTSLGTYSLVQKGYIARFSEGGPTGINPTTTNNFQINIYPNPSNGLVTLSTAIDNTFIIMDLNGRIIEEFEVLKGLKSIIINQPNGIYLIKDKQYGSVHRLIIQNP